MSRATGQMPYIYHRGQEITDTNLIIEYLQKQFRLKEDKSIGKDDLACCYAFSSMADHSLFGAYVSYGTRFGSLAKCYVLPIPALVKNYVLSKMIKDIDRRMSARGIGRKNKVEVVQIGKEDIKAISSYLGDKKFIAGDKMSQADCSLFSHLVLITTLQYENPFAVCINEDCPNLAPYIERIKQQCWPDWDSLIQN